MIERQTQAHIEKMCLARVFTARQTTSLIHHVEIVQRQQHITLLRPPELYLTIFDFNDRQVSSGVLLLVTTCITVV